MDESWDETVDAMEDIADMMTCGDEIAFTQYFGGDGWIFVWITKVSLN